MSCRTAKNTQVFALQQRAMGELFSFDDLFLQVDDQTLYAVIHKFGLLKRAMARLQ